jgi:FkbM family methyltransferase
MWSALIRTINRLNPTTHGRKYLARFTSSALPNTIRPCTIERGFTLDLDIGDSMERAIYFNAFETLDLRCVENHISPGDCVIDIGANIGLYSLIALKKVGQAGHVVSFEPNPVVRERLTTHIARNGFSSRSVILPYALGNEPGSFEIYIPSDATHGHASLKPISPDDRPIRVEVRRLDDALNLSRKVNFIKIDIEGAEYNAIAGGMKLIERDRPKFLLEINEAAAKRFGTKPADVVELLLRCHPDYKIDQIKAHDIQRIELAQVLDGSCDGTNLLLT